MNQKNTGLGLLKFGDRLRMIIQIVMREIAIRTFPVTLLLRFESARSMAASLETNTITDFIKRC